MLTSILHLFLRYLRTNVIWLVSLLAVCLFFIFLAWLAYPPAFGILVGLMAAVTALALLLPLAILVWRHRRIEQAFDAFLEQPDDQHEQTLCHTAPAPLAPSIHTLANHLRQQRTALSEATLQLTSYEDYLERWVHEVKTPLALMTLVLDNRATEMSPPVRQRLLHARSQIHEDVQQVLFFARLGAAHRDYHFEPLELLAICREAAADHQGLLEESSLSLICAGAAHTVTSDRKGLLFILGQLISNTAKYAQETSDADKTMLFAVEALPEGEQETRPPASAAPLAPSALGVPLAPSSPASVILRVSDNGPGVPAADLPFIFDKGFTGNNSTQAHRSTGMGLYLVRRMAYDLGITLQAESAQVPAPAHGLAITLVFPLVR